MKDGLVLLQITKRAYKNFVNKLEFIVEINDLGPRLYCPKDNSNIITNTTTGIHLGLQ